MRRVALLLLLASCGGARPAPEPVDEPAAAPNEVTCYAGREHTGNDYMGEERAILLRRTVAPGFGRITEEWAFPGDAHGWTDLYTVDDARGTASVTTTYDAPDAEAPPVAQANLYGDAWHWDSWRWSREDGADMTSAMNFERNPTGLSASGGSQFNHESSSTRDFTLAVFDCAEWDARTAAAAPPPAAP